MLRNKSNPEMKEIRTMKICSWRSDWKISFFFLMKSFKCRNFSEILLAVQKLCWSASVEENTVIIQVLFEVNDSKKNVYAWRAIVVIATVYVLRRGCELAEGTSTISSVQLYLAVVPNTTSPQPNPSSHLENANIVPLPFFKHIKMHGA